MNSRFPKVFEVDIGKKSANCHSLKTFNNHYIKFRFSEGINKGRNYPGLRSIKEF